MKCFLQCARTFVSALSFLCKNKLIINNGEENYFLTTISVLSESKEMIVNKGGSFLLTSTLLEGALIHWSGPRRGG